MAAFYVFDECKSGSHTDCPRVISLTPEELAAHMMGGAHCSCECHFNDD